MTVPSCRAAEAGGWEVAPPEKRVVMEGDCP